MDTTTTDIVKFSFDYAKPSVILETNWLFLIAIVVILLLIRYIVLKDKLKLFNWYEMEVEISGSPKAKFKVERNNDNLYIANRIYIELTTRKAAIPFDQGRDVIEEVYNSWYKLFSIIRDELKSLPGNYLRGHDPTTALIGLTTKILNDGLRPHLTEYQAKFRRWYEQEKIKEENLTLSPQEIQKKYPDYNQLIASIKQVNKTLIDYSNELNKLIRG